MSLALVEQKEQKEEIKGETKLCCRFLEDDEYWKLLDIFEEYKDEVPNPKISRIAVVEIEDTKEIIGFFCYQLMFHAEPLWIKEEYRSSGVWVKLVEMVLPQTEGKKTYVIATSKETEIMCKRLGLRRIEHPVYVKDI